MIPKFLLFHMMVKLSGRCIGKTLVMILSIKQTIECGGTAGVFGLKDESRILSQLFIWGVNAKAKPMIKTTPFRVLFDEYGEPIGINYGEKIQVGFVFSLLR